MLSRAIALLENRLPISRALWVKLELLKTLVQRDLAARYKGSLLGNGWTLVNQIAQLLIMTYVFSVVLKVKTPVPLNPMVNDQMTFGAWLFAGLVPWNAFVNGVLPTTMAVVNQPSLVKKVVFPLTLLPLVPICTAFVDSITGLVVLIAFWGITARDVSDVIFLLPLVWLPQLLLTAGIGYLVAGLTVFLRDIPQTMAVILNLMFYATPIMYPRDPKLIPEPFYSIILWNPFSAIAEVYRDLILVGKVEHWSDWGYLYLVAIGFFWLGSSVYRRLSPAFADVL